MTTILQGIGWFLFKVYEFFENLGAPGAYALALVVFTVLVKTVLFPLSYMGKKSMMRTTALQGRMRRLEAQYGKNRQKYQEEVAKLYAEENVNPMSGCLWSLLPLPILMGLYSIIRRPMLYMLHIPAEAITKALEAAGSAITVNSAYAEIELAGKLANTDVFNKVAAAIPEYADRLQPINFNLFGIDLGHTPKLAFWQSFDELGVWCAVGLFLIPLVVTLFNFLYTRYSMKSNQALTAPETVKKNKKEVGASSTERSGNMMMWLMPLMYLWFGYSMPAGMCIYMLVNALVQMGQDAISVRMMRKSFQAMLAEQERKEEEAKQLQAAHKAEIAARRAAEREAAKNSKGKKAKKKPAKKVTNTNGRIGMRTYALGRDYDPDRYGGVTLYHDPQELIDEQAVEEALKSKRRRKADAVEKALAEAEEQGDLDSVIALEKQQAALEEAEEEAVEALEGAETAEEVTEEASVEEKDAEEESEKPSENA